MIADFEISPASSQDDMLEKRSNAFSHASKTSCLTKKDQDVQSAILKHQPVFVPVSTLNPRTLMAEVPLSEG